MILINISQCMLWNKETEFASKASIMIFFHALYM